MLTIAQIRLLLAWNEQALVKTLQAIGRTESANAGALYEDLQRLQAHRAVLKDCLVEALETNLQAKAA